MHLQYIQWKIDFLKDNIGKHNRYATSLWQAAKENVEYFAEAFSAASRIDMHFFFSDILQNAKYFVYVLFLKHQKQNPFFISISLK